MDLDFEVVSSESEELGLQVDSDSSSSEFVLLQSNSCLQVDLSVLSPSCELVPRRDDWPDSISYPLDLDIQDSIAVFRPSAAYQHISAPVVADPTQLLYFLHFYPFHVQTLQRLSLHYERKAEVDMAQGTLEHLLFAFQMALTTRSVVLTDLKVHYAASEFNTLFLDSLQRYALVLSQKKAYLKALELSKLFLSLRPEKNELSAVLMVELMALETKQTDFLKVFHCNYMKDFHCEGELLWLPSSLYNSALAKALQLDTQPAITSEHVTACEQLRCFQDLSDVSASTQLLAAVSLYPSIAAILLRRKLSAQRQDWTEHTPLGSVQPLSVCYAEMFGHLWSGWPLHWLNAAWVRSLKDTALRERLLSGVKPLLPLTIVLPVRPTPKAACAAPLWSLLAAVLPSE